MIKKVKDFLSDLGISFIDFMYPKICIVTGQRLADNNSNSFLDDSLLPVLEKPTRDDFKFFRSALNTEFFYSSYIFRNNNEIRTIIHYLKYKGFTSIGEFFGELIGQEILKSNKEVLSNYHYLLPVPLFSAKLRERGYNQSFHICKGLYKSLPLELADNAVLRIKNTKSQTGLSLKERTENVKDAFFLTEEYNLILDNKGILIIDDVITTGSTVKEIIRTIKRNTSARTGVISLAIAKS